MSNNRDVFCDGGTVFLGPKWKSDTERGVLQTLYLLLWGKCYMGTANRLAFHKVSDKWRKLLTSI